MTIPRDDSETPDGHSPCGHRNEPNARFCDECGAKLPIQCPGCLALNRSQAKFCARCGIALRDGRGAASVASSAEIAPSREAASTASEHVPVTSEGDQDESIKAAETADAVPSAEAVDSDYDGRLTQIKTFLEHAQPRRRRRRWPAIAGAILVLGILSTAIFNARLATRKFEPLAIDGAPQASIPTAVDVNPSRGAAAYTARGETSHDGTVAAADRSGSGKGGDAHRQPAVASVTPRTGGELRFIVPGEPPSYDGHREETFALMHPAAPHYNTLLRIDPLDPTGTRVVGDLATSWTVSKDRRTYVLRLRQGVRFHDGSEMTSRDVRATYEKIINPPAGIMSARKGEYLQIETVQTPEPYVVAFKLRWPSPSFIHSLASPWNWIYKADILERDVRWYEKHIMGTGPFVFVEHVKGSHWIGRRNIHYWDTGKPYLDGYRALFVRDDSAQLSALRSGEADIQFRGFSPAQREILVQALGAKVTVQESAWNCALVVAVNHEKHPFHDVRVRRALSLALDRYGAARALSKTAIVREVAGVQVPGSPFATPADELMRLAGYWRDIRESRSEARRLLAEAGVPEGFASVLKNRDITMPYQRIGAWLVEEWRRIGLNVEQKTLPSREYFDDLRSGNFELSTDFQCGYVVDPDLDLYKFQSRSRSDANYGRYTDPTLDELYVRQSRAVDPELRRRYIRAFEKRLLDDQAHYIYTLQWHRIVPHNSRVRGWTVTPSHYINNQLDTVWLSE